MKISLVAALDTMYFILLYVYLTVIVTTYFGEKKAYAHVIKYGALL